MTTETEEGPASYEQIGFFPSFRVLQRPWSLCRSPNVNVNNNVNNKREYDRTYISNSYSNQVLSTYKEIVGKQ